MIKDLSMTMHSSMQQSMQPSIQQSIQTSIQQELENFYHRLGFTGTAEQERKTVPVYVGCLLVPLPNIETRHKYLKYHDLHHLINNYSVGRIGEGEVSAWELGTGTFVTNPMLAIMNLIALSTGLLLRPKRMWLAFVKGCHSINLYDVKMRNAIDNNQWDSIESLKKDVLYVKGNNATKPLQTISSQSMSSQSMSLRIMTVRVMRALEFLFYAILSLVIHAIISLPALVFYRCLNYFFHRDIVLAINPPKRNDLY